MSTKLTVGAEDVLKPVAHNDGCAEQPAPDTLDESVGNVQPDSVRPAAGESVAADADADVPDEPEGTVESIIKSETAQSDQAPAGSVLRRALAYGLLPALALMVTLGVAYLKWLDCQARDTQLARIQSVQTATESTVAILSYRPETVDRDLHNAHDRLTGPFRDSYTALITDVVIPGAKQKKISTVATVPAAASVSATPSHAVVLVFVDQTTTVGDDAPTSNASSVRVSLDKIGQRWLISEFTPV